MEAFMAFDISPFSSTDRAESVHSYNAVSDAVSGSSFISCLTSVADALFAPVYDFLKSDLGKAELIREYIEEHNLYTNPHPLKVSDKIENIDSDFYQNKELPTRKDLLLVLNDVINRIEQSEANIPQTQKKFTGLLAELKAIKTIVMARKEELVLSPEEFAEIALHLEALHLTDLVKHSLFYKEIELLYRETTRASFELKKHIASRVMVDALKEQMTIGFYKADKDKVSKGFSWSCWIFEIGTTLEVAKLKARTNDDEGTPALSEQKEITVSSRADIGIKGLATGYIDGRIKHSRGKYKEGNTIEHFVEKNFSRLIQDEKEFRENPLIAACASNVSFLKYASGKEDNFFVRATTRNQLGQLNDNKEVMGDFKVSRRAWAHQIASIKTSQARQEAGEKGQVFVESIPPTPPNPTPPTFAFHGYKKTSSTAVSGGIHAGNDAIGSVDLSGGGRIESSEVMAKAMKTNFCSFLTHQYINREARNRFKGELKARTDVLVKNELDLQFQSEWKSKGSEDRLALLKGQFDEYAKLHENFSFNKNEHNDARLRNFGDIYGLPKSKDHNHAWLAANIMYRMAVLNASLMLEPVERLEQEKKNLDGATKKLIELELEVFLDAESEHRNELIKEINETGMLIAQIKQRIKAINTELDKYKEFEKLLLDPPFATDSKFMKRHCYRHRKLTLEWTIYEKKWVATSTQALGLAAFTKSGVYQDYFKKHNNPLRIGTYKDTISVTSAETTELSEVAPGVFGHLELWWRGMEKWAEGIGDQLGFGGLILKKEKGEKILKRRFLMEGVELLDGEKMPKLLKRNLDVNTFTAGVKGSGHVGMGFKVSAGAEHSEEVTMTEGDIYYGESFIQYTMLDMNDYDKDYLGSDGKVKDARNLACWRNGVLKKQKSGLHELFVNCKEQLPNGDGLVKGQFLNREMNVFIHDVENSEQSEEAKQLFRDRLEEFRNITSRYDETRQTNAHLALGECLNKHDAIKEACQEVVVKKLEDKIERMKAYGLRTDLISEDRRWALSERKACEKALKNIADGLEAFDKALSEYNGYDFSAIVNALDVLSLAYEQADSSLHGSERNGLGTVGNKLNDFKNELIRFKDAVKQYDDQLLKTSDAFYFLLNAYQPHFKEKKLNSRCYDHIPMPEFHKKRAVPRVERWEQPAWNPYTRADHDSLKLYAALM